VRGIDVDVQAGLDVRFRVHGVFKAPPPAAPRFADGLWQHTCFEVFVARPGMPGYLEFNLSPSGEWAAYAFSSYRQGMTRLGTPIRIDFSEGILKAEIPLERGPWRIGLSAVIEEEGGALSCWALAHPPGRPDFHHRDGFALELA
jgi:hypothetical protein